MRALTYLILLLLGFLSAKPTTAFIEEYIYRGKKDELPKEVRELVLMPIMDQLRSEMEDVCTADCLRLTGLRRTTLSAEKDELDTYWSRFNPNGLPEDGDNRNLWIEKTDGACVVGFEVDKDHDCPLVHFEATPDNVEDLLTIVKRVAAFRKNQAAEKEAAERLEQEKHSKKGAPVAKGV